MNPFSRGLSRRQLLKALSSAAVMSPFVPLLGAQAAPATPFVRPKNLVILYHPNGLEPGWKPTMLNGELVLGSVLQALEPFRKRLLAVHGLHAGIRHEVAAHGEGMTSLWTGSVITKGDAYAAHPSIDQLIAEKISIGTPLSSLELGVQSQTGFGAGDNQSVMIYSRNGKVQPEDDPDAAFRRLFVGSASAADIARARQERTSVLDLVKSDLARVRGMYGAQELPKLDAHLEGVRSLEKRLDELEGLSCNTSAHKAHGLTGSALVADENFPKLADLQSDLLVLALKCGVTKVASLQLSNSVSDRRIPMVNPGLGIHAVMHAGTRQERILINRYLVSVVAKLLQKLSDEKRADGTSLLDETLVVWGTEMAIGNHLRDPVPFFIAGGHPTDGYFKQNTLLELTQPHRTTRLLMSAAEAMGVEGIQTLGDLVDETSRGPLPGASRVS